MPLNVLQVYIRTDISDKEFIFMKLLYSSKRYIYVTFIQYNIPTVLFNKKRRVLTASSRSLI